MNSGDFCCNPVTTWLTVNRQCNFRCPWCYGEGTHYEPKETMSIETAKELVKISIEAGSRNFTIIGGEPTLWPHLFELNQFCRELGATTGIITNSARFGNDEFWEQYKQCPCDNISVSVKSVDRVQFQNVTKAKLFDQTIKD
jgi:molybdenum cofactor biosynthesis enzyme MoaA